MYNLHRLYMYMYLSTALVVLAFSPFLYAEKEKRQGLPMLVIVWSVHVVFHVPTLTFSSKTGVLIATAPCLLKHDVMIENTFSRMAIWNGS